MQIELAPGYRISRLIKGGWHLAGGHGPVDRRQAIADMAQYVQAGLTTFDCADIYTGLAPRVQVHTKLVPDYDRLASLQSSEVENIIHRSRQRLRQDTLDLVQFHWWDTAVAGYLEVAQTLQRLQAQGYIRHIGLTNFNTTLTRQLVQAGLPVISTQVQYSVLDRRPEAQLLPYARQQGVSLLVYGSLAGGFVSPHWLNQPEPSGPFDNRSLTKYKLIIDDAGGWELFQALLHTLLAHLGTHAESFTANILGSFVAGSQSLKPSTSASRSRFIGLVDCFALSTSIKRTANQRCTSTSSGSLPSSKTADNLSST